MKCEKCGGEFSPKVYKLHKQRCQPVKIDEETLRQLAKEQGVSNYWNKSIERLLEEVM